MSPIVFQKILYPWAENKTFLMESFFKQDIFWLRTEWLDQTEPTRPAVFYCDPDVFLLCLVFTLAGLACTAVRTLNQYGDSVLLREKWRGGRRTWWCGWSPRCWSASCAPLPPSVPRAAAATTVGSVSSAPTQRSTFFPSLSTPTSSTSSQYDIISNIVEIKTSRCLYRSCAALAYFSGHEDKIQGNYMS